MKFLIDENLPPRLAAWLSARGHDALHARDIGAIGAPDQRVLQAALESGRIIVTQDRDFDAATSAIVLRLCLGNAATPILIAWLDARLESALTQIEAGERLVLVETD